MGIMLPDVPKPTGVVVGRFREWGYTQMFIFMQQMHRLFLGVGGHHGILLVVLITLAFRVETRTYAPPTFIPSRECFGGLVIDGCTKLSSGRSTS